MDFMSRRLFVAAAGALLVNGPARANARTLVVFRDENCECCGAWVEHMKAAGFEADVRIDPLMNRRKTELGVPPALRSCHTAQIGGYVLEGHVPAAEVRRLLETRPPASGLTVPRMPVGSPGMEAPGAEPDRYDVVLFSGEQTSVFATYLGDQKQVR